MNHSSKIARADRRRAARTAAGLSTARLAGALCLALSLSACGGMSTWRGLDSVHQPVVSHSTSSIDLTTGGNGLAPGERERLTGWFDALNLRYGDHIAVDDPLASDATRDAVQQSAAKFGLLVGNEVPVTEGHVNAGTARIIVTRSVATVPGCPDWSSNSESNFMSATHSNYGCAVNSNLAAMVANPDDLLHGSHGTGLSNVTTSDKAIGAFGARQPSGASGSVKSESSKGG
jgi:pilus assembly protein CpaD